MEGPEAVAMGVLALGRSLVGLEGRGGGRRGCCGCRQVEVAVDGFLGVVEVDGGAGRGDVALAFKPSASRGAIGVW